jgi:hypothetical protein
VYRAIRISGSYLAPADIDIQKLEQYLKGQEFFDEIVVLKDGGMTLDKLRGPPAINPNRYTWLSVRIASQPASGHLLPFHGWPAVMLSTSLSAA